MNHVLPQTPPFLDPVQTIQDLTDAIDYIKTHGWTQNQDFDGENRCCAFGALRGVTGDDNPRFSSVATRDRCSNAARAFYRHFGTDITLYNDKPGRTQDEVTDALMTVAAVLRKDPNRA